MGRLCLFELPRGMIAVFCKSRLADVMIVRASRLGVHPRDRLPATAAERAAQLPFYLTRAARTG
jgi:hypothetical protein